MSENKDRPCYRTKDQVVAAVRSIPRWIIKGSKRLSRKETKKIKKQRLPSKLKKKKDCDGTINLAEEKSELERRRDPLGLEFSITQ